ncbi:MAG TPA: PEP-CTERM sorting domain-containing protein [Verrucomicrobiota bacterium]|nr:PEP-CTERM sorting domain-containing protein [Verrucomicrobiota bacterium]
MAVLFVGVEQVHAQILPNSPTTLWTPVLYGANNPTIPDPASDQQTGSKESDIVGNTNHPSLFTRFYNGGTPSLTDGQMAFRLRLAEEKNPVGYNGAAFIGMDGNGDGALDIFVGVNNSGSSDMVGIWAAGTGANISPSTTTIANSAFRSYGQGTTNYGWTVVNATSDPLALTFDVDNGGAADRFLSFVVPFADVVAAMNSVGIFGFNENSLLSYVAATATQANSLNQDLNGVNGGVNSSATWASLGALTLPYSASGAPALVPEPSMVSLLLLGISSLVGIRARRKTSK